MPSLTEPDPRTMDCIARLIGFDTVSRNSNLELLDWARAHLEQHGATIRMDFNEDRQKANLLASFGEGPGGLVLSGHTDVVPVDGQDWASDPFTATVRDGKLFGRGACDMKGFVGVILGHAPDYAKAARREPIHVALSYDEEVGCLGIPRLIEAMQGWGIKPTGCLVGEPTSMRPVSAHKGGRVYRCKVTGKAAHSSLAPSAVNAVEYAARLIALIQSLADHERRGGLRAEGFDVPHTTISANVFRGGTAANIVPAAAELMFEFRYVPGFDPEALIAKIRRFAAEELEPAMQAVDAQTGIEIALVNAIPALDAKEGDAIFRRVCDLVPGETVEKVSYGTEASFFQNSGVPAMVCGPGSIVQAHKADEYVTLEQLARCDRFIDGLIGATAG
ncbi:acetylornithine deacetylase [Rhizobiales bacterium GAS113]|jgi:acetylornithine deacetylase|nr:acetylornithine deacetylase [Rhizobiales bacterium GAS113]